jgi:hypothetical protein
MDDSFQVVEEKAFELFVVLMQAINLRAQYLPDMSATQAHMYKFTRLLHRNAPLLHAHLEAHGVDAFLYAVPWFLCCFGSQFSLAFALRVLGMRAPHPYGRHH